MKAAMLGALIVLLGSVSHNAHAQLGITSRVTTQSLPEAEQIRLATTVEDGLTYIRTEYGSQGRYSFSFNAGVALNSLAGHPITASEAQVIIARTLGLAANTNHQQPFDKMVEVLKGSQLSPLAQDTLMEQVGRVNSSVANMRSIVSIFKAQKTITKETRFRLNRIALGVTYPSRDRVTIDNLNPNRKKNPELEREALEIAISQDNEPASAVKEASRSYRPVNAEESTAISSTVNELVAAVKTNPSNENISALKQFERYLAKIHEMVREAAKSATEDAKAEK